MWWPFASKGLTLVYGEGRASLSSCVSVHLLLQTNRNYGPDMPLLKGFQDSVHYMNGSGALPERFQS